MIIPIIITLINMVLCFMYNLKINNKNFNYLFNNQIKKIAISNLIVLILSIFYFEN